MSVSSHSVAGFVSDAKPRFPMLLNENFNAFFDCTSEDVIGRNKLKSKSWQRQRTMELAKLI